MNTEQEEFWSGQFASQYINRNNDIKKRLPSRTKLLSDAFRRTQGVESATEFGANIGINLLALKNISYSISLNAVEISTEACSKLTNIPDLNILNKSILELADEDLPIVDLVFTSGVLIHINPEYLNSVYDSLYKFSKKYILIAEYYDPNPQVIPYHGQDNMLFKRDFAGEMLDRYSDLKLLDYGFQYHRDANFPLDDITWFLMEKVA